MSSLASSRESNDQGGLAAAKKAHLRYRMDHVPGIQRIRRADGFEYRSSRGRLITDPRTLDRIRKLAIPPAWENVWICPSHFGHLQATGRDAKGRKQYRYHPRWRMVRDENKFERLIAFAEDLPRIRRRVRRDLRLPGLPRPKVLATVVKLLEETMIRVGNEEYARQNHSFGLTTLRNSHARIRKHEILFEFRGKGGTPHRVSIHDRRLARIVKRCQDLPGQLLFQYVDEAGKRHAIDSADVNNYLKEASGGEYTAKDFRTWAATWLAARTFTTHLRGPAAKGTKRALKQGILEVARQLGHTPAICKKCYIHPVIIDAYLDGSVATISGCVSNSSRPAKALSEQDLLQWLGRRMNRRKMNKTHPSPSSSALGQVA
jgi:DNA topoisomerase-1